MNINVLAPINTEFKAFVSHVGGFDGHSANSFSSNS